MNYIVLPVQGTAYKNILPGSLAEMAGKGGLLVIGGCSSAGKLECVAAFALAPFHRDEAMLKYIFVPEKDRRRGYGHGLLEYARIRLKNTGVRAITVRLCSAEEGLTKFLQHEKFIPLSFQGKMYEYSLSAFAGNAMLQKMPAENMKKAVTITDPDDIRLKRFRERAKGDRFYMGTDDHDLRFSRFYQEDRELTSCLLAERCGGNVLFIARSHKLSICTEPAAWAFLFASSIKTAQELMPADAIVQIQSFEKAEYTFLQRLTGSVAKEYRVQELARRL